MGQTFLILKAHLCIILFITLLSSDTFPQRKNILVEVEPNSDSIAKHFTPEIYEPNGIIFSDSVMRYPNIKSIRFEMNASLVGDKAIREEIAGKSETSPDRWYGLSIYAPAAYLPDLEPEIVTQWHNNPDFKLGEGWLSPSNSLWVQNGRWQFVTLWDTARVTIQNHWMGRIVTDLGVVKQNSWTDWVFHLKFSYKEDGIVEIYKEGQLVYYKKGPNFFNDDLLPYWKIGIYKWVFMNHNLSSHEFPQRVLFFSQIRKGNENASYKDVAP